MNINAASVNTRSENTFDVGNVRKMAKPKDVISEM